MVGIREYDTKQGIRYSYTINLGTVGGKRKKQERGGFITEAEAVTARELALRELNGTGSIFEPSKMSFDELATEYIEVHSPLNKRPSTIVRYRSIYEHHIKKVLGAYNITAIKTKAIDSLLAGMMKEGYSTEYIRSVSNFIKAIYSYAMDKDYIRHSPAKTVSKIKEIPKQVEILLPEEIDKLLQALDNSALKTSFIIGLNTGLRVGEVFGLRWKDIDLKKRLINVNHQLVTDNHSHWSIADTKTLSSHRIIGISPALTEYLLQVKATQEHNRQIAGEWYKDNKVYNNFLRSFEVVTDFVNVKENGEYLTSDSSKYISRVAHSLGIKKYHFHLLRHTHATELLEAGASIKLVQQRLGHAKGETTLQIYSHVTIQHEENIIDTLPIRPSYAHN